MPDFIVAYHGGKTPDTPEEGAAHMAGWKARISELGGAVLNPGTPLGQSVFLDSGGVSDGGGRDGLSGFTTLRADSIEAAVEMARACPHCNIGTVEVAEMMKMP